MGRVVLFREGPLLQGLQLSGTLRAHLPQLQGDLLAVRKSPVGREHGKPEGFGLGSYRNTEVRAA